MKWGLCINILNPTDLKQMEKWKDIEGLRNELLEYLIYYNEHRPHQGQDNRMTIDFIPKS